MDKTVGEALHSKQLHELTGFKNGLEFLSHQLQKNPQLNEGLYQKFATAVSRYGNLLRQNHQPSATVTDLEIRFPQICKLLLEKEPERSVPELLQQIGMTIQKIEDMILELRSKKQSDLQSCH